MAGERWFRDTNGWQSLFYEGNTGVLLGGRDGAVYVLEDKNTDNGTLIPLKWRSRYYDQDAPDNEKTYQDVVIEADTKGAALTVTVFLNNGETSQAIGTLVTSSREPVVFALGSQFGLRGRNIAIEIEGDAPDSNDPVKIFGITLHYYGEARAAKNWDSDEQDAGTQSVKRVRAVELDLQNSAQVTVEVQTDMPGNAMVTRESLIVQPSTTRRKAQVPIPRLSHVEGRHYRVVVFATDGNTEFYLYAGRVQLQPYGTYIEAYEGAAGGHYDSFDLPLVKGHVCRGKLLELDVDTDGAVTAEVRTDLPGNDLVVRESSSVNTETTTTGRRMVRIPLEPYPEGHLWRVLVYGSEAIRLYGARLEYKPYGVYVEAYEASGGRTWDSDFLKLGTAKVKEIREVKFDVDTDGPLTMNLYTELPGLDVQNRAAATVDSTVSTPGRRMVSAPLSAPVEGRLFRVELAGASAFRLYSAWALVRPIGYTVEAYRAGVHYWDSSVLDLGTPQVKRILRLQIEAQSDSPLTVETHSSLASGEVALRATDTVPASPTTRETHIVQLDGVYGRLVRLKITSTAAWKLFKVRVYVKPIGVYLNGGSDQVFPIEPEQDLGSEQIKVFKEIEVVYSADADGTLTFHTELPSGHTTHATFSLATSTVTTTAKLRLPPTATGRLVKAEFQPGAGDLRVYAARVWTRTLGQAEAWRWVTLPLPPTPDNYQWADIHVAPTPPAWEWQELPLTETPLNWDWRDLPVTPTPELPKWLDLPVQL
jgi:hypothetical protein